MPEQALRRRAWFGAVVIAAMSFLDVLAVHLTVPAEGGRVLLPLDLSRPAVVAALYAAVLVLMLLSWFFFRKALLQAARGARIIVLLAAVLLAARGVFAVQGSGAPFDRARAARTVGRLRYVDERVKEFHRVRGRFPADLRELGLPRHELVDEWRHELRFELLPGATGYRLWAEGAPVGKSGLEDYYPRLTIERDGKDLP